MRSLATSSGHCRNSRGKLIGDAPQVEAAAAAFYSLAATNRIATALKKKNVGFEAR